MVSKRAHCEVSSFDVAFLSIRGAAARRHLYDGLHGVQVATFLPEHRRSERSDCQQDHADAIKIGCPGQTHHGCEKACEYRWKAEGQVSFDQSMLTVDSRAH